MKSLLQIDNLTIDFLSEESTARAVNGISFSVKHNFSSLFYDKLIINNI